MEGTDFTIDLPYKPSTGYSWVLKEKKGGVKSIDENTEGIAAASAVKAIGGTERQRFSFKATKSGRAVLVFWYMRSWEKTSIKQYRIAITVPRKRRRFFLFAEDEASEYADYEDYTQ